MALVQRVHLLCLLLVLWSGLGTLGAQELPMLPFHPSDINSMQVQAQRLLSWHLVVSPLAGGPTWYDLIGQRHHTITGNADGFGFQPTNRSHWWGEMRLNGSSTVLLGTNDTFYDFLDQTFTVSLRWRATVAGYLVGKRASAGGWWLRVESDGTLTARITDAGNIAAAERTTVGTGYMDGAWHHATVVFTTDTITAANNDVTIYADGVLDQGARSTSSALPATACACALAFGARSDQTVGSFLTGSIDDIRIYAGSLPTTVLATVPKQEPLWLDGFIDPLRGFVSQVQAALFLRRPPHVSQ